MTKYFFERNRIALGELENFAPDDNQLLDIPFQKMANDTFILALHSVQNQFTGKNTALLGLDLLSFLQSINVMLSTILSSFNY